MSSDVDELDTYEYTITDVVEADPYNIVRLWKFTVRDSSGGNPNKPELFTRETSVEVFVSHDISCAYESNMDTDGGRDVEIAEVPTPVKQRLANRLERTAAVLRGETTDWELQEDTNE